MSHASNVFTGSIGSSSPFSFVLRPTSLAVAIALHAVAALAQTAPAPSATDAGRTLSTVTVNADASAEGLPKPFAGGQVARGARIGVLGNQDIMDTPFSFSSYTQEVIADQQSRSIGDVLLNDSAVRSSRGFGNFQQAYFIRGFPVYSDDITYNGLYGLVPRQYMATEFIERVEVFRGANTFLSGSGSGGASPAGGGLGGLVNVVPKRAPNEPLNRLTVGAQTGGQGYVAADLARRFGEDQATGVRLNAARRDGGSGLDGEKQELSVLSIGLDWRSRNARLSADLGYQKNDLNATRPSVTPGFGIPIVAAPDASRNFAQPWTYSNSKDIFGTLRGEFDINESLTAWGAVGIRTGDESNSLAEPRLTDTLGNTSSYRFDNTRKEKAKTAEVGLRAKFDTGGVGHTVVASASSFSLRERNAYAFSSFAGFASNLYQPTAVAPPAANFFTGGVLGNPLLLSSIDTTGLALGDTMSFMQDKLLLTLGVRRQTIDTKDHDPNTGNVLAGTSYKASHTLPLAGVVFKLTPQVSLFGNYTEGLIKGQTITPAAPAPQVPVVFAPYVATQKEIGAKYDGGSVGASVAFFTTEKPDAYLENNVPGVYGEQRNRGVELSVFGEPAKGLRVIGGVTLLDAKQTRTAGGTNNGNDVVGVPNYQFNIGADLDVPGVRGLAVDARVLRTGRQYADGANTQSIPAWTRTDIGARYLLDTGSNKLVTLRARVENLFDKNYWSSVGGYPGQSYLVLGAPRTLVVSASIDF